MQLQTLVLLAPAKQQVIIGTAVPVQFVHICLAHGSLTLVCACDVLPLNHTLKLFLVYHPQVLLLLSAPACKRQHSQVLKQRPSHQKSGWRPLSSKWPQPGIWRMREAELRASCRHSSKLCCIRQHHRQVTSHVMLLPASHPADFVCV